MFGKKKGKIIHAVCYYCKKTDFRANMECGSWVWDSWSHKECYRKSEGLMACPKCKGTGEVPIEKEEAADGTA